MSTDERLTAVEERLRELTEAVQRLVGVLLERNEPARTFGRRTDVFGPGEEERT